MIAAIALGAAALLSFGVLWLAALGVRERHALEPRPARSLGSRSRTSASTASCSAGDRWSSFAMLETWIHARAGMQMHWWQCLDGPVHRNAVPILLGLSLAAAAILSAFRHVLAWARRVAHVLRRLLVPRVAIRPQPLAARRIAAPAWLLARALRARGPPALSLP